MEGDGRGRGEPIFAARSIKRTVWSAKTFELCETDKRAPRTI